ncbi:MAG: transcription antitermination factor NusB [Ignavibacteriales bacterium]|nr:MAG: NusB antitermination factor [Stygiobacter sp.]KAF0215705.1 MAG: NusB antitermination [Ignavibacteria bacterium]MBI3123303.1 transcription antitermination factor NusB [Ignavibacteriales bacterium]OGU77521.1 MAG: transcription antitermination factor NusB [Stygiobacter sp. RIFOXYA12_FULL_38_9]OGV06739.1 MAG: transcription antitermination factor NusB [Stygiobacter sp. RIFOXYB2_FULL_37_11]OGV15122.1 MAG: transcription antitermination factor NusB [Stygiobacter sp. RIFOXYC2_FULL_38_25]OGV170
MKTNRRILREKVLQVLYAYELNGDGLTILMNGILADVTNQADLEFAKQLVNKVVANKKSLEQEIHTKVANWEMDRIALIDKLLLQIGITELMYFPEIPPKVSINEVIEIAKDYSTSNSGKFINGILDAILSELKESGNLNKSGRGLIGESLPKKNSQD